MKKASAGSNYSMVEIPIGWFTIISQKDVEEMRGTYGEERTATATVRSLQIESNPSRSSYAYLALVEEEDKGKLYNDLPPIERTL